jgi:uncharacterized protein involved in exopolysaccharide biosynthesis/Mrp family chromosome partitioning ATPase
MTTNHIGRDNERPETMRQQAAQIEETTPLDLLRAAHRSLIGRYRVAIPLALALAVIGAGVTHLVLKPRYVSTGLLHVAPPNPNLSLDENAVTVPPRYQSFVSAQATLIASRAVIDRAIDDANLEGSGWPTGEKGLEKLAESLSVYHRDGEQLIKVSVSANDQVQAQAATNAILTAYQELYGERNGLSMGVQETMFNAQVDRLNKSLAENRDAIDRIVTPYGGLEALEAMHDAKVASIARLDEKTTELAVQKADSQLKTTPDQQGYELLAMIASGNPTGAQTPAQASIQDLIEEDARLQAKIDRLRARGYGGRHPDVQSLKSAREQIAEAADHRKQLVNQIIESIGLPFVKPDGTVAQTPQTIERLQTELTRLRERLSKEIVAMGNAIGEVATLQEKGERLRERLDRARDQLQTIQIQSGEHSLGQVSIAQQASFPVWASSDRRTAGSAVAGIFMFFLGIASVIGSGYFRTKIACLRDLREYEGDTPLLSVFVTPKRKNTDRDPLTAVATHDLRNTLFTDAGTHGTRVFAIASAGEPGSQTVIASSLAQSFAMAGYQTLLVDGDFAGQFLSNRYSHGSNDLGLRDLIDTGDPRGTVHRTPKPRLWMMPSGVTPEVTAETLSADDVSLFLEMALKHYDVVVIDAGSATKNLESVLFTGACDRAVLSVDRNESKRTIEEATGRLHRAGVPAQGLVYADADYEDARREGMICEKSIAESMYPEGLSRVGRNAPSFDNKAVQPDAEMDETSQTAAA